MSSLNAPKTAESTSATEDATFCLISNDGFGLPITIAAARQSRVLRDAFLCIDPTSDSEAPVDVGSETLPRIVEWMEHHRNDPDGSDDESNVPILDGDARISTWDTRFLDVDPSTLCTHVLAANYLDIPLLYHLLCKAIANLIRGKSTEEMRQILGIENDWAEGEEEQIREENQWAVDEDCDDGKEKVTQEDDVADESGSSASRKG